MQFQKPTLNRGHLGDKFTALANVRPVESVSYFVNGVTITLCRLLHMRPFQIDTSMKLLLHQMSADIKSLNTKVDALLGQKKVSTTMTTT